MTAMSRGQLRELSPDATRAVREMIQRKRQGQEGTCPRPAKPAQQLRQLGDIGAIRRAMLVPLKDLITQPFLRHL